MAESVRVLVDEAAGCRRELSSLGEKISEDYAGNRCI